jgi:hypothetical protein
MANEPDKKLVLDGLEIPAIEGVPSVDDEAVSTIFEAILAMDEAEQADVILSTSTA